MKITARRWVTAEAPYFPGEARHLIAAFGILGCVITGTAGAVLTLRIDPGLTTLALAELVLALTSAILIAAGGWARDRSGTSKTPSRENSRPR